MVAVVLTISLFVLILTGMMPRQQPRFLDHDKDQAALIERLSAFLDRHHLWNQFLTEDKGRES